MKQRLGGLLWCVLSMAPGAVLTLAVTAFAQNDAGGPEEVFAWLPPEVRAVAFLVSGVGLGLFVVVALAIKFIIQPSKEADDMEGPFGRLDERLNRFEGRLDQIDGRFNTIDERFNGVERDLRRLMAMWRNGTSRSTGGA